MLNPVRRDMRVRLQRGSRALCGDRLVWIDEGTMGTVEQWDDEGLNVKVKFDGFDNGAWLARRLLRSADATPGSHE